MSRISCQTAGESHGAAVVALVEGLPAGLSVDVGRIDAELTRRQGGYGRSGRQNIERDRVRVLTGLIRGVTIASPVAMVIENKDFRIDEAPAMHAPRPGHADLAGALKYLTSDCRAVVERASARETAGRVAAGALARQLIERFGMRCIGFVARIGEVAAEVAEDLTVEELVRRRDASEVYCPDEKVSAEMMAAIRAAKERKDTLGGIVEVRVEGVPPGLGSCMRWQDKLDGRLMRAVGSIQAIKGVEIGAGFGVASRFGSEVHDEIYAVGAEGAEGAAEKGRMRNFAEQDSPLGKMGFVRGGNNAGGIEGGMSNGMAIVVRAVMKPISTLPAGLASVDLRTRAATHSDYERSDVCAVPAASVVAENVVAMEIADAFCEKFAGDTIVEIEAAYRAYCDAAGRLK